MKIFCERAQRTAAESKGFPGLAQEIGRAYERVRIGRLEHCLHVGDPGFGHVAQDIALARTAPERPEPFGAIGKAAAARAHGLLEGQAESVVAREAELLGQAQHGAGADARGRRDAAHGVDGNLRRHVERELGGLLQLRAELGIGRGQLIEDGIETGHAGACF